MKELKAIFGKMEEYQHKKGKMVDLDGFMTKVSTNNGRRC